MKLTYDDIVRKVTDRDNFAFSRWGDGEFYCLMQTPGKVQNCDGHRYFPDLGARLRGILDSRPPYYLGTSPRFVAEAQGNPVFDPLFGKNRWVPMGLLKQASVDGNLRPFFNALFTRDVILVGNAALRAVPFHYGVFIEVPLVDCWYDYRRVREEVTQHVRPDSVVLYCASMMTNVLVDDFHKLPITQIDCGSVFDPYVGRFTRKYHRGMKLG